MGDRADARNRLQRLNVLSRAVLRNLHRQRAILVERHQVFGKTHQPEARRDFIIQQGTRQLIRRRQQFLIQCHDFALHALVKCALHDAMRGRDVDGEFTLVFLLSRGLRAAERRSGRAWGRAG